MIFNDQNSQRKIVLIKVIGGHKRMTKIFKNMAPYWYMIVAIVLLLVVQAFGDLSLPQYTSDIIDVGIQNKGVEHILPVKMTEDEYEISQLYMTSKEKKIWEDTYKKKGEYYICK